MMASFILQFWQQDFEDCRITQLIQDSLDGTSVPPHCRISEARSISNECPSSEWRFMQTWMSLTDDSLPKTVVDQAPLLGFYSIGPLATQLTGKKSIRRYLETDAENSLVAQGDETCTFNSITGSTQQAVIADALSNTGALWQSTIKFAQPRGHHGSLLRDERSAIHSITKDYYQPYSSVYCVRDMIQDQNDQRPMAFPISIYVDYKSSPDLLKHVNASIQGCPATEYPSILRGQLLNLPGSKSTNRFKWVQLPQDVFPGSSVGLIVLLPPDPNDLPKQNTTSLVVCNIGAGWGESSINITSYDVGMSATTSVFNVNTDLYADDPSVSGVGYYQANTPKSVYYNPPFYPSKSIEIGVAWA